jgi:hypothetical protein
LKAIKVILISALMIGMSSQVDAHTNSIGYTSNGGGSATFWYGNWHPGTTFNEGSISLLGISGVTYSQTQAFSLLSSTTPTGLTPGTNYFTSNGTALVAYDPAIQLSSTWQGATFTGLTAGTYRFTYIPISFPTANWNPMDSIILSSTITLTDLFLSSGGSANFVDLNPNAYGLRSAFNLQSAAINAGLSYDCTTFDMHNICVSAGGRYTNADSPSANSAGALLIASYRATDNLRIGGYLDQNITTHNTTGIQLSNSNPMGGIFAVWNQNTDGTGLQTRIAAGYSDKDITITRNTGLNTEAGAGTSSLISKAVSATVSYGKQLGDSNWIASPYAGIRYAKTTRNAYTEDTSVSTPLTYSSLSQETTTALVGVHLNGQISERINLMGGIGLEQDMSHHVGDYVAIGVDSLAFNSNIKRTRPIAVAGASFAIDYRQTVTANVSYRQEAFQSSDSFTGLVTYQVGF